MSHPLLHKAPTTRRGRTGRRRRTARSNTMHDHSDIIRGRGRRFDLEIATRTH